jgi:hypothetical protein
LGLQQYNFPVKDNGKKSGSLQGNGKESGPTVPAPAGNLNSRESSFEKRLLSQAFPLPGTQQIEQGRKGTIPPYYGQALSRPGDSLKTREGDDLSIPRSKINPPLKFSLFLFRVPQIKKNSSFLK